MGMNRDAPASIHEWLDVRGLPWRETRGALAERHGVRKHPAYDWDVIEIATRQPLLSGLLWPMSVAAFPQFSPHVPATDFSSAAWYGDDARENLRRAREEVPDTLGDPTPTSTSNTLGFRWKSGPASLELTVWPADLQSWKMTNPSHEREPRLVLACHVTVKTGFRLEPSPEEQAMLASFERIAPIDVGGHTSASVRSSAANESELEFVREPRPELDPLFGFVGSSRNGRELVFFGEQLYVVPIARVLRFRVERILPAKGPGGSHLSVECRTDFDAQPTKRLSICSGAAPDDLNELARHLAEHLERPFELAPYDHDA